MNRRNVLKTLGAGALGAATVAGSSGSAAADHGGNHYSNPTHPYEFADPTVIQADDGTYYAYASNMERDQESQEAMVPILESTDLVNWTYIGDAFDSYPTWRDDDASLWAPDVTYYNGEYRIYYSYSVWGSNNNPGIGLATSSTPDGTFTDQGPVFRESDLGMTNCIDAEFRVVDGTPYMVWGSWYGIHGVELTSDGRDYVSGTTFHLAGDHKEGAWIMNENGYWYLFYSTGNCCDGYSSDYAVEVGRADSFFGPYYTPDGTDLRDLNEHHSGYTILSGTDRFPGTGHNGGIQDDAGNWWMLYHGYDTQLSEYVEGTWNRVLFTDRIRFDSNDWPVIGCDGHPTLESSMPHESGYSCTSSASGGGGPISDGTYWIENVASGKAMDVNGSSTSDGANVIQWGYWGGTNQQWDVTQNADGTYTITNVNSGKLLEVANADTSDGANIQQYADSGHATQDWNIIENSDGTYRLENANSGKVADLENGSTSDGANILQWGWWGGDNQKWTFNSV
ncbi:MAG: family 43 glycosylhydrolase [Haloarculaceae archaeon]